MTHPDFHVITGASGAGKSTLLAALSNLGYSTIPEAALALLHEQQQCKGTLLPWIDRVAFTEEVLARNVRNHEAARSLKAPVFFDRGIPECLAWLKLWGVDLEPRHLEAAAQHRYAPVVFVAEPWPEIYVQDAVRQASFDRAARSFEPTVAAYVEAGYRTCVLPKVSVQERVAFVLEKLQTGASMAATAPPDLHLRPAQSTDVAAITECVQAAYAPWVARIGRKPWPMLQDYAAVVRDQHVTIAQSGDELVGVLVQADTDEGSLIENVAVRPDFKGRGVGRTLLVHAEREARARGHSSIYLYTNELMTENIALYARGGFIEYERRQEPGFRRVFMRKALG